MDLIGYIRVSTEEQANNGQSLGVQDLQLQKYCELHGHELVDVIVDDGVSASIDLMKRPGGRELVQRLMQGEAEGFVVQRLDRAFRITMDGLLMVEQFNKRDLTIHSVHEHIDTTTAFGRFVLRSLLSMSELERDKISERNKEVSDGLREQGKAWGHTPYGCVKVDGLLYRDPNTWPVREEIMQWREEGATQMSWRGIVNRLMQRRTPAPNGGRKWHVSTLQGIVESHHAIECYPLLSAKKETAVSIFSRVGKPSTGKD